jgi:murein L,D-transpeptidase YafK
MIHGLAPERHGFGAAHWQFNWTNGCIAVTDREIEEIWQRVEIGTPIEIRP